MRLTKLSHLPPTDASKRLKDRSVKNWRRKPKRSARNGLDVIRTSKIAKRLTTRSISSLRIKRMLVTIEPCQGLIQLAQDPSFQVMPRRVTLPNKFNLRNKMFKSVLMRWFRSKILLRKISRLKQPSLTPKWILKTPLRESTLTSSAMMLTLMSRWRSKMKSNFKMPSMYSWRKRWKSKLKLEERPSSLLKQRRIQRRRSVLRWNKLLRMLKLRPSRRLRNMSLQRRELLKPRKRSS